MKKTQVKKREDIIGKVIEKVTIPIGYRDMIIQFTDNTFIIFRCDSFMHGLFNTTDRLPELAIDTYNKWWDFDLITWEEKEEWVEKSKIIYQEKLKENKEIITENEIDRLKELMKKYPNIVTQEIQHD